MSELIAYLDDSGSGGDSPYCVVAGYMATGNTWTKFSNAWQDALDKEPSIQYFKSTEAESLRGEFWGWEITDRNARVEKLVGVATRYGLTEVCVAVPIAAYNSTIKSTLSEKVRNPYFMCVAGIMASFSAYLPSDDRVSLVFDRQGSFEKFTVGVYGELKSLPRFRDKILSVSHADDKCILPLQAADMIAWQTRRYLCVTDERPRPTLASLLNLPGLRTTMDSAVLRDLARMLSLIP